MKNFKSKPFYLNEEELNWVNETYEKMTLDEKIGQLFCLVGYGFDEKYLIAVAKDIKAGALMCRAMTNEECCDTVRTLQENSKIPMLISANIESGGNGILVDGTKIGSPMQIAATGDVKYASILGEVCAAEGSAAGANWTYAPIVDIDFNYRNPITNTRTFGSDAKRVAEFGKAYIEACQRGGVMATAKHFPGDGVDDRDQHLTTTVNTLSVKDWEKSYGEVYRTCIDAGVKSIMVGHISLPYYVKELNPSIQDSDILPASLSYETVTMLLKNKLGFNGLVCTDASAMAGMNIAMPRNKLVPMAIAAGCDMFTFTRNLEEDFRYMKDGVEDGTISEQRLEEAVKTILAAKASEGLIHNRRIPTKENLKKVLSCAQYKKYAKEIADQSITIVKEEKGVLPLSCDKYKNILLYDISSGANTVGYGAKGGVFESFKNILERKGYTTKTFVPPLGMEGMMQSFEEMKKKYDLIIYIANLATKSNQTTVRIEWSNPMGANVPIYMTSIPTIFISVENPYHLQDVPRVRTYINTYSGDNVVLEALVQKLEGESKFVGISPSDPFCGKWDTRL